MMSLVSYSLLACGAKQGYPTFTSPLCNPNEKQRGDISKIYLYADNAVLYMQTRCLLTEAVYPVCLELSLTMSFLFYKSTVVCYFPLYFQPSQGSALSIFCVWGAIKNFQHDFICTQMQHCTVLLSKRRNKRQIVSDISVENENNFKPVC